MKRIMILLGVLVIGVAGVIGFRSYLASLVPKEDPQFQKTPAEDDGPITTGQPVAPAA